MHGPAALLDALERQRALARDCVANVERFLAIDDGPLWWKPDPERDERVTCGLREFIRTRHVLKSAIDADSPFIRERLLAFVAAVRPEGEPFPLDGYVNENSEYRRLRRERVIQVFGTDNLFLTAHECVFRWLETTHSRADEILRAVENGDLVGGLYKLSRKAVGWFDARSVTDAVEAEFAWARQALGRRDVDALMARFFPNSGSANGHTPGAVYTRLHKTQEWCKIIGGLERKGEISAKTLGRREKAHGLIRSPNSNDRTRSYSAESIERAYPGYLAKNEPEVYRLYLEATGTM